MKTFFASLGGAVVGSILGLALLVFAGFALVQFAVGDAMRSAGGPGVSQEDGDPIVLTLDLRNGYADQSPTSGPALLFGGGTGFTDLILRIEAAALDDQVKGLFVRASEMGLSSSQAEELRDVFQTFQAADKFIITHSQGMFSGGVSAYRAMAPSDEIWVQPGTSVVAGGLVLETIFLKNLFENLSITPEFEAFYEFKSAANTFEEDTYTDAHRSNITQLAESFWTISLGDIASDRGLTLGQARESLEASPITAAQMVERGLADELGWPEDAFEAALARGGEDAIDLSLDMYVAPTSDFGSPVIAIVGGQGTIVTGGTGGSLFQEGSAFASDTIASAILEAGRDEDVEAIVFRIDSGGGSPSASDQIWRAVERVQTEEEKPVIVSMASAAASGGYYVAAGADWIVANRNTITGSIGIFGGKFAVQDGLARIGINAESIKVGGPFAGALSTTEALTDEQRSRFRAYLAQGYDRFTGLVADGRGLTAEQIDEVARGRVFSGADAYEVGLVDELGGLTSAIAKARELAEIEPDADVRLMTYPQSISGFPFVGASTGATAADLQAIGRLAALVNDPEIQALMSEVEAMRDLRVQARAPTFIER
ncbi:MAG: signal peptide peptidase SppA [Pseudomonadota bacterium]